MIRGRKPKPTQLKVITGNPGGRPLNKFEIAPPMSKSPPKPPAHLLPEGKAEWKRLAPTLTLLGVLSELDAAPFAAYCQAYARWMQAERLLAKLAEQDPAGMGAMLIKTRGGGVMPNPLVWVARNAANDMVRYAAEFGFTPSARSRIQFATPTSSPESRLQYNYFND